MSYEISFLPGPSCSAPHFRYPLAFVIVIIPRYIELVDIVDRARWFMYARIFAVF